MVNTMIDEVKVCLIGAGGIGSTLVHFLAPSLSKSKTKIDFHILDSDIVEDRNIQFQQFSDSDIGVKKLIVFQNHTLAEISKSKQTNLT